MTAQVDLPQNLSGLQLNAEGKIDLGAMRPWLGKDNRPYVNIGGQAVLVTNALLQKDEWIAYDSAVKSVGVIRLNGINDLRSAGLVWNAGDLGSSIAEWETSSDMTAAGVNMSGVAMTEKDSTAFGLAGTPIPIIRKDFQVNIRRLLASRRMGQGVDVTSAQTAARLVAEKSESLLFNGSGLTTGSYTGYGYTNHPQRATGSITNWSFTGTTGATIVDEVNAMITAIEAKKHYGPYMLYIPGSYAGKMRVDYSAAKGDNTIYDRIRALDKIIDVKVSDQLATNNVVLVQMTSDVIDLAIAQDIMSVQWERGDGMQTNFAVMAAWAPRIKPDYNGNLGIAHYSV